MITQVSVILENEPGKLSVPCRALAQGGINIMAMSLTATNRLGVLRLVVSDPDRAMQILDDADCVVEADQVLAVAVPDRPGGLEDALETVEAEHINLEYLYSFTRPVGESVVLVCSFADIPAAVAALQAANVDMIDDLDSLRPGGQ